MKSIKLSVVEAQEFRSLDEQMLSDLLLVDRKTVDRWGRRISAPGALYSILISTLLYALMDKSLGSPEEILARIHKKCMLEGPRAAIGWLLVTHLGQARVSAEALPEV